MIPSFVINLDSSPERMTHADDVLRRVGLAPERVSGVDGRLLDEGALAIYDDARSRRYMGRSMSLGEIGCYLSHVRALDALVASGAPLGLVFEDDVDVVAGAEARLPAILETVTDRPDWHALNLGPTGLKITSAYATASGDTPIMRAHYFPMLAHAMVWSRAGAQAYLAQAAQTIFCPADNMMRYVLTRSDMGLAVAPRLFSSGAFDSDISARSGGNRSHQGRSVFYGWRKQKRLMSEKIIARRHQKRRAAGGM